VTAVAAAYRPGVYVPRDERSDIEDIVLDYVHQAYRHRQPGQPEPSISATDVLDYLLQHGRCPATLRYAVRRRQQAWVRALLQTSVTGGRLDTSLGLSGRTGSEVRLYSPVVTR
jgi:hypothetical protein